MATFKEGLFYSLERVVLHLEHQKTVSQGLLCVKRKSVFISTSKNDFLRLILGKNKLEKKNRKAQSFAVP